MLNKVHKRDIIVYFIVSIVALCGVIFSDISEAQSQPKPEPIVAVCLKEATVEAEPVEQEIQLFYPLTAEERDYIEHIVSGEARGESYLGKILVAQCIYDACVYENMRPIEAIKKYQYAGWCEEVSDEVKQAVSDVFDYGTMGVEDNILWFYAPKYDVGRFHNTQRFVVEEGGHKFFASWN